jgi:hypothetical protein
LRPPEPIFTNLFSQHPVNKVKREFSLGENMCGKYHLEPSMENDFGMLSLDVQVFVNFPNSGVGKKF